jgi:hypothetical protein
LALLAPRRLAHLEKHTPFPLLPLTTPIHQYIKDISDRLVYNFCMMPLMVKETDLDLIEVPEDYEVLDSTALGRRLEDVMNSI